MTFPSVVSDLLMFAPSLRRCPVAPVELALSEPAKSTKLATGCQLGSPQCSKESADLIRDTFSVSRFVSTSCLFMVNSRVNTAWDRDDLSKGVFGQMDVKSAASQPTSRSCW